MSNIFTKPVRLGRFGNLSRRAILFLVGVIIVGILCLSWAYCIEPNQLKITRVTLPVQEWKGTGKSFRFTVAGDFHLNPSDHDRLRRIVHAIQKEDSDAIMLLGDYVKGTEPSHAMPLAEITQGLKPLSEVAPCFAVRGNHDEWQGCSRIRKALEGAGIQVIEQKNFLISNKENTTIRIAGLPDFGTKPVRKDKIPKMKMLSEDPSVLLSHTPDAVPMLLDKGINLILCGHTHGGQMCLPGGIPVITPCPGEGKKYASGLYKKNNTFIYTTRGLGTSILPLRFFCPPEITIITLSGDAEETSITEEHSS